MVPKEWLGFGRQKQFAVEQAKHDWVLCVDADERVSPELAASIAAAMAAPVSPVYRMPRRNRFLGRWLSHGEGYPDWSPRLFNRQNARWSDDLVHEKVLFAVTPGTLARRPDARFLRRPHRLSRAPEPLHHARRAPGVRAGSRRAASFICSLSPVVRFIKFYLLRLGFLDGVPGLLHISIGCMNSYLKYAKLIELRRAESQARGAPLAPLLEGCAVAEYPSPDRRGIPPVAAARQRLRARCEGPLTPTAASASAAERTRCAVFRRQRNCSGESS
mgnify:CR=1 FL=1